MRMHRGAQMWLRRIGAVWSGARWSMCARLNEGRHGCHHLYIGYRDRMSANEIQRLYDGLNSPGVESKKIGRTATTLLAMIVSALPLVGGPLSLALDKLGDRLLLPDVEEHLKAIENYLLRLAPRIGQLEALDERVRAITETLFNQPEIIRILRQIVAATAPNLLDEFAVNNVGGIQELSKIVVDNMHLVSKASEGATTTLNNVTHSGPAKFDTDHARQSISNSRFSGRPQGVATFADIKNATLGQGTVHTNFSDGTRVAAIAVFRTIGPDDPGGPTIRAVAGGAPLWRPRR
jgi:hypothetical protein